MNKEIKELKSWNNPATLSHDEIESLVEREVHQERKRIIEIISEEEGIDFIGIQLQGYSINEIKEMIIKAIK